MKSKNFRLAAFNAVTQITKNGQRVEIIVPQIRRDRHGPNHSGEYILCQILPLVPQRFEYIYERNLKSSID